jgi:hypothetical protein
LAVNPCRLEVINIIYYYKFTFFPGCRPKVYSADTIAWKIWKEYESQNPKCMKRLKKETVKRMKGVKSHLVRQQFTHKCYVRAILTGKPRFVEYFCINSRMHQVSTYKKGKLGLSGKTRFFIDFIIIKESGTFKKHTIFLFFSLL